jgi:hypothetical protein
VAAVRSHQAQANGLAAPALYAAGIWGGGRLQHSSQLPPEPKSTAKEPAAAANARGGGTSARPQWPFLLFLEVPAGRAASK